MIEKNQIMPLNYYKKNAFTGSYHGMRYRLVKTEREEKKYLTVTIWPEPYNFEKTPEEEKQTMDFPFDESGREAAVDWLNEQYRSKIAICE